MRGEFNSVLSAKDLFAKRIASIKENGIGENRFIQFYGYDRFSDRGTLCSFISILIE